MKEFVTSLPIGKFAVKTEPVLSVNGEYEWEMKFRPSKDIEAGGTIKIVVPPYQHQRSEEYLQTYDYWQKNYIYGYCKDESNPVELIIQNVESAFSHINRWKDSSRVAVLKFSKGIKKADELTVKFGGINRPWLEGECEPSRVSQFAFKRDGTFLKNKVYIDARGDSCFQELDVFPEIEVVPDKLMKAMVYAPTVVRPNEKFNVKVVYTDRFNNPINNVVAEKLIVMDLESKRQHVVNASEDGLSMKFDKPGYYELSVVNGDLINEKAVVICSNTLERIFWGDMHCHSNLSANIRDNDPNATPESGYEYARDVSNLDFVCMSEQTFKFDSDRSVNVDSKAWEQIGNVADSYNIPDEFTTFSGIELHSERGDTIILFGESLSTFDYPNEDIDEVSKLWANYRGKKILTIPHLHRYCEGRPRKDQQEVMHKGFDLNNWAQDDAFESLCEIYSSQWGRFESPNHPMILKARSNVKGNTYQEFLARKKIWGVTAGSDGHDGNPGYGGITGIYAGENKRGSLYEALRNRKTIATTHTRMLLNLEIDGNGIGTVSDSNDASRKICIQVVVPAAIDSIELIKNEKIMFCDTSSDQLYMNEIIDKDIDEDDRYYLRVKLENGHIGWCSPLWFRGKN